MKSYDFVVSYANPCVAVAASVMEQLATSARVFCGPVTVGRPWPDVVEEAIRGAWVTVVVVCAHTAAGHHQREEIDLAVALMRAGEHAVVVLTLSCDEKTPEIPLGVRTLTRVDIGDGAAPQIKHSVDAIIGVLDDIRSRAGRGWRTRDDPLGDDPTALRLMKIKHYQARGLLDADDVTRIRLIVLERGLFE